MTRSSRRLAVLSAYIPYTRPAGLRNGTAMSPHIVGSPDPERFRVPVASAFLVRGTSRLGEEDCPWFCFVFWFVLIVLLKTVFHLLWTICFLISSLILFWKDVWSVFWCLFCFFSCHFLKTMKMFFLNSILAPAVGNQWGSQTWVRTSAPAVREAWHKKAIPSDEPVCRRCPRLRSAQARWLL